MLYEMSLPTHGRAGERQIPDPRFGLTHNLGGVPFMNVLSIGHHRKVFESACKTFWVIEQ